MWLKLRKKKKNIYEVQRRIQEFWLEGRAKPQITRNDVIKIFRKKELFMGQRYRKMEDQKSGLGSCM